LIQLTPHLFLILHLSFILRILFDIDENLNKNLNAVTKGKGHARGTHARHRSAPRPRA